MKDVALEKAKRLLDRYGLPVQETARLASIWCVTLGLDNYFPMPKLKHDLRPGQILVPSVRPDRRMSSDDNMNHLQLLSKEFTHRAGCKKVVKPEFGNILSLDAHQDLVNEVPDYVRAWLMMDLYADNLRSPDECPVVVPDDDFAACFELLFFVQTNNEYFRQVSLLERSERPEFCATGFVITDNNFDEKVFHCHFDGNEPRLELAHRSISRTNLFNPRSKVVEIIE